MFCKNCGHKIEEGKKFCKNCGTPVAKAQSTSDYPTVKQPTLQKNRHLHHLLKWARQHKKQLLIGGIVALALVGLVALAASGNSSDNKTKSQPTSVDSDTLSSLVVDILCSTSNGDGSGGSGTIMTANGIILTNNHIIPEDSKGNPTVKECLVTLADSQGKIKTIYQGTPQTIPKLSLKDDLAFIVINKSYTDDSGTTYGSYPTTFPNFVDLGCTNSNPTLGEAVRVFGYPAISAGGYYLTVTDGVVSSLPNDGTILTSATVDHGDSGGLAVDENGCEIGIPEAVSGDGSGALGVLISNDVISQFMQDIPSEDSSTPTNSSDTLNSTDSASNSCPSGSLWNGSSCQCNSGEIWNTSKTQCITETQYCVNTNGSHSIYDSNNDTCSCADGYYLSTVSNTCVSHDAICSQKYANSIWDGSSCSCPSGYVSNSDQTACVTNSYDQQCQNSYGSSSYYTGQTNSQGGPTCDCKNGSSWNSAKTACISNTQYDLQCKNSYGSNTYYTGQTNSDGKVICDCKAGYYWDNGKTACYSSAQYDSQCKVSYGSGSYYSTTQDSCECSYGYTYSNSSKWCVLNQ